MNQKNNLLFMIIFPYIIFTAVEAIDFSLDGLTSWIKGIHKETFFKEIPFDSNGTLILENDSGSIIVKSWSFPKVAIQALKKAPDKELSLLDIETSLLSNQLIVRSLNGSKNGSIEYQLIVPTNTNIVCKGKDCLIKTKNISGIQKITTNTTIDIQGACNTVHASTSGMITAGFSNIPPQASISLNSIKSSIALTLPMHCNVSLNGTTHYNSIISHQLITLKPITLVMNKQSWDHLKKTVNGMVGIGGPVIDMTAYSGITIY